MKGDCGHVVDAHAHYMAPALVEEVERKGATYGARIDRLDDGRTHLIFPDGPQTRPFYDAVLDIDERLTYLTQTGVGAQVVSSWADLAGYHLPADKAVAWARLQNETMTDAVAAHPDTFIAMGALPMQDVGAALHEMRHGVDHLGLKAFQVCTSVDGGDLDGEEYRPFWELADDLGVLVFLHPPVRQVGAERLGDYFLTNLLGNPFETSVAAARLIFSGLFVELPEVRIMLAHGGGILPYQVGRLDRGFDANPATRVSLDRRPSEFLGSFYYDTVLFDDHALELLLKVVPEDRVVLGTDYPFPIRDDHMVERLERQPGLSVEALDGVLGGNIRRVLDRR